MYLDSSLREGWSHHLIAALTDGSDSFRPTHHSMDRQGFSNIFLGGRDFISLCKLYGKGIPYLGISSRTPHEY